jgi:hypothetical protein
MGDCILEKANYLLADVLEYLGLVLFITSLRISFSEALDPHVNRRRYKRNGGLTDDTWISIAYGIV